MQITSKYKVCKRLGSSVFEKCQTQKFVISEARSQKTRKRRRQLSDYGKQLIEKQRLRYTYGISEKQFSRYIEESMTQKKTDPKDALVCKLESRLDNVAYRMGLANTRRLARQLVSHGHITVNGRKVTIPSFEVGQGDSITVREGSKNRTYFQNLSSQEERISAPAWLKVAEKDMSAEVTGVPAVENTEMHSDLNEVLSYYSR